MAFKRKKMVSGADAAAEFAARRAALKAQAPQVKLTLEQAHERAKAEGLVLSERDGMFYLTDSQATEVLGYGLTLDRAFAMLALKRQKESR